MSKRPLLRTFRNISGAYIWMLILLPSGSLFGVNVKVLTFLLLLPLTIQVAFAQGQVTVGRLVRLLSVPAILLLWAFLSQIYGFDFNQALWQYNYLFVTISSCWFAAVLCADDQQGTLFILRSILYAEVFTSTLKVTLLAYAFLRGIPVSVLIGIIRGIFGVQLMAYDFDTALGRLEFISDNVVPISLFAILCYRHILRLRAGRALFMVFVLTLSSLFSFSRYLWGLTALALVLGLLCGQKDRFQAVLLTTLGVITFFSLPLLIVIIELRFSVLVVSSSDADRIQQIAALRVFVADAPWFGHGLGSYTSRCIRSPTAPWSYEAQLLALVGQVGIVGVSLLGVLMMSYFDWFLARGRRSNLRSLGLFTLLMAWLAGGLLNPSIISSAASVSYVAIFAMAMLHERSVSPASIDHLTRSRGNWFSGLHHSSEGHV